MLLMRGSCGRSLTAFAFGFICLCVLMQVLGTTMTLWDFEFQLDPVDAPLFEGFSLPVGFSDLQPPTLITSFTDTSRKSRVILGGQTLFHPPNVLP